MKTSLVLRVVGILFVAALPTLAVKAGISTTSGVILGHISPNRTDVTEYLGIPYAASTSGSQRWLPPQRFVSAENFTASIYGPYVCRSCALE